MGHSAAWQRSILVVENEPLIALDIASELEVLGVVVEIAYSLRQATTLVEADGLAAAILDQELIDGDCLALCSRLKERDIPFVIYSGLPSIGAACANGAYVDKPARKGQLADTIEQLLQQPTPVVSLCAEPTPLLWAEFF